jgi:hypothetical protein
LSVGLAELVIIVIALVAVAKLAAAGRRNHDAAHRTRARAMGGRVASRPGTGEVCRYEGTADGIAWALSVVTMDDIDTPRRTTLVWRTGSVRSDRVLVVVGNDIRTGGASRGWLGASGYPLGLDPTADGNAMIVRTTAPPPIVAFAEAAHEVAGILRGLPEGFRVFAEDDEIARRVLSGAVTEAISRWHAVHGGALRIWVGGPDLRLMIAGINWPPPAAFCDLLDLGLGVAREATSIVGRTGAVHGH